jgi:hypothetical protein
MKRHRNLKRNTVIRLDGIAAWGKKVVRLYYDRTLRPHEQFQLQVILTGRTQIRDPIKNFHIYEIYIIHAGSCYPSQRLHAVLHALETTVVLSELTSEDSYRITNKGKH